MRGAIRFLLENSLFLLFGAVVGLVWANLDHEAYEAFLHLALLELPSSWFGTPHGDHRVLDIHFLINDLGMAFFFAIAGKEVWEAFLPRGALNDPRKAAAPLIATAGGVVVPAGLYILGTLLLGQWDELGRGWAIPCATDIAFSYMVARLIFGHGHPAIAFLLLLAIADDAIGLLIIAVAYPQQPLEPAWLLLPVAGVVVGLGLRQLRIHNFWPYLLTAGTLSWLGFAMSGIHPALGLLPIIPVMPHAHVDTGLFDWSGMERDDTLSSFELWWKNPVEIVLALFGLVNAGVMLSSVGSATWLVLVGLLVGKPLGIWGAGLVATRALKLGLPDGMNERDLFVVGCAGAIGFTVALFVSTAAFPAGAVLDAAKMGALGSFFATALTWIAAVVLRVRKFEGTAAGKPWESDSEDS
jgi:NhaA family Na+:H+ antiporter